MHESIKNKLLSLLKKLIIGAGSASTTRHPYEVFSLAKSGLL
jgi:hypothetical protein